MSENFDVLIKDSNIVDGTGKQVFKGNIGIKGEKIVAVGNIKGDATIEIDGSGLVTCPGFIDPHNHGDHTILQYPLAENLIMQGITTFLGGQCGGSAAPTKDVSFDEFLLKVEKTGISVNFAMLVGCTTLRLIVMGEDFKRKATPDEIEKMKKYAEEAMCNGAFGISSGLDPNPAEYAAIGEYVPKEIVELVKVAQKYGGIYQPHTYHNQTQWPTENLEEMGYGLYHGPIEDVWVGRYRGYVQAIEISKAANNIPLHIAHLHSAYPIYQPHPDFLARAAAKATFVEIIDKAREEGLDVSFNAVIPDSGIARANPLINEFPGRNVALNWLNQFGKEELVEKLKKREFRDKIIKVYIAGKLKLGMVHTKQDPFWFNCFKIVKCKKREYEGKTIGEITHNKNPSFVARAATKAASTMPSTDPLETLFDILVEDPDTIWFQHIDKRHNQINQVLLTHPFGSPCTDVGTLPAKLEPGQSLPNNIAYGAYAFYIGTYVREKVILSLEEAIRKVTSLPAQVIGLENRGVLRPDAYADIVLFNSETINMSDNPLNPTIPPTGIKQVLVNGEIIYKTMAHTGARPGKVLKHK